MVRSRATTRDFSASDKPVEGLPAKTARRPHALRVDNGRPGPEPRSLRLRTAARPTSQRPPTLCPWSLRHAATVGCGNHRHRGLSPLHAPTTDPPTSSFRLPSRNQERRRKHHPLTHHLASNLPLSGGEAQLSCVAPRPGAPTVVLVLVPDNFRSSPVDAENGPVLDRIRRDPAYGIEDGCRVCCQPIGPQIYVSGWSAHLIGSQQHTALEDEPVRVRRTRQAVQKAFQDVQLVQFRGGGRCAWPDSAGPGQCDRLRWRAWDEKSQQDLQGRTQIRCGLRECVRPSS